MLGSVPGSELWVSETAKKKVSYLAGVKIVCNHMYTDCFLGETCTWVLLKTRIWTVYQSIVIWLKNRLGENCSPKVNNLFSKIQLCGVSCIFLIHIEELLNMSSVQSAKCNTSLQVKLQNSNCQISVNHSYPKKGSKIALMPLTEQKFYRLLDTFCTYFVNAKLKEMVENKR